MFKIIFHFLPVLIFWGIFAFVVWKIPYPESLTQANLVQLLSFFIALLLALSITINFFLNNIFSSLAITLGLIFLLILKALDSLNIVTGILTTVATYLLASYFRKAKKKNLTSQTKISKLRSL